MVRRRIRVLGIATTSHGFAFAAMEGPTRLLGWGQRDARSLPKLAAALARAVERWRPTLVAYEGERRAHQTSRGSAFMSLLVEMCRNSGGCLVRVDGPRRSREAVTSTVVAEEVAKTFPTLKRVLPKRRRLWDGADDRIGVFLAASAALCAVRQVEGDEQERKSVYDDT